MKYNVAIAFVCFNTKNFILKNINLIKKLNKTPSLNIKFYICDNNTKKTYMYTKNTCTCTIRRTIYLHFCKMFDNITIRGSVVRTKEKGTQCTKIFRVF